jgi:hypothetical protein
MRLERVQLDPDVTIGHLTIDGGDWTCWTCEDVVRDGPKVPGQTAIPFGNYNVRLTWSPHFNRNLPLLLNVPGFEGVRIHPGNTAADTEGCILVGLDREPKGVGRSRMAFDTLFGMISTAASKGEAINLTIV